MRGHQCWFWFSLKWLTFCGITLGQNPITKPLVNVRAARLLMDRMLVLLPNSNKALNSQKSTSSKISNFSGQIFVCDAYNFIMNSCSPHKAQLRSATFICMITISTNPSVAPHFPAGLEQFWPARWEKFGWMNDSDFLIFSKIQRTNALTSRPSQTTTTTTTV